MGSTGFSWKLADHPKLPKGKLVAMIVLDGWGEASPDNYNCIHVAEPPAIDSLKNVIDLSLFVYLLIYLFSVSIIIQLSLPNNIMLNDLCEELNVEILSRLPTKSLLRFRSVSKSLCACIGSRGFIRIHTLDLRRKSCPDTNFLSRICMHYIQKANCHVLAYHQLSILSDVPALLLVHVTEFRVFMKMLMDVPAICMNW
ncbi:putative phosphoglycerate mutase (2,3-diphosphoglycerate-independent) [Helianthus anomalus]